MKKALVIPSLLLCFYAAFGQGTDKVTAWVDMQQTDGKAVISCWCQNHSSSPLHLSYQAILVDADTLVREGKTLAIPEQPNLLLNANFLVEDGQFDQVILKIFLKNELVAISQAFGPKLEVPVATHPTVPLPISAEPLGLDGAEIGGLVLDETRSKLAHDFYEQFYNSWSSVEEDIKTNYSISIREQPTGIGIGTRVMVELNGEELLQLNLQPRLEIIESLAAQLVETLYTQIMNPDQQYQEINSEDISGSGIY